jgi:hypothetical protein
LCRPRSSEGVKKETTSGTYLFAQPRRRNETASGASPTSEGLFLPLRGFLSSFLQFPFRLFRTQPRRRKKETTSGTYLFAQPRRRNETASGASPTSEGLFLPLRGFLSSFFQFPFRLLPTQHRRRKKETTSGTFLFAQPRRRNETASGASTNLGGVVFTPSMFFKFLLSISF